MWAIGDLLWFFSTDPAIGLDTTRVKKDLTYKRE